MYFSNLFMQTLLSVFKFICVDEKNTLLKTAILEWYWNDAVRFQPLSMGTTGSKCTCIFFVQDH